MNRTSMLASGIATALLLVSAPGAQAVVTAKDTPNKANIVKAFPELADGQFSTDKSKKIGAPGTTCGSSTTVRAKSAVAITGSSTSGTTVVVGGVAELKSHAKAKAYIAKYKKYVKACPSYTDPRTGATVTLQLTRAPKLGQASLAFVQQTSILGITSHSATVLIRYDKRIGSVAAVDDAPVSTTSIKNLAKVTAKKMK